MRVAVTGGRGFIGTHVVAALRERGHRVDVIDVIGAPSISVLDRSALRDAFDGADAVVHLAGPVRDPMLRQPVAGMRLQVGGTHCVLDACVDVGVPWFLLASSFFVYSGTEDAVASEHTIVDARRLDRFGIAKLASERLCVRTARLDYAICRFGSAYGPGGSNAVRSFIETGLAGKPISVWGRGLRRNQYTYVCDIAEAVADLVARRGEFAGAILNIVSPAVTTTAALADLVASMTGTHVEFLADRPEGPSLPYIDSHHTRDRLRWRDTPLADGIRETMRSLRAFAPSS